MLGASNPRPTDERRRRFTFVGPLLAIAAVGLIGRLLYSWLNRSIVVTSDGLHYSYGAVLLADGKGMINPMLELINGTATPDATHPPLWTLVLAGVISAGFRTHWAYQVVAAVIGTATIVVAGFAAKEAFGRRVGLITAGLVAVYPGIWLYERELTSEPLALLFVAGLLLLVYRFRAAPSFVWAVAIGIVLGLAALTRSELVLISLFVVVPLVVGRRDASWGRRIAWLASAGAATALLIAPWFAFNLTRFEEPVPLSVGLGATMQAGNCPPTYEGDLIGYYHFGCVLLVPGLDPDGSVADGQMRSRALDFMALDKAKTAEVSLIRVGRTFSVYEPLRQRELEAERGSPIWILTLALAGYWLLVPFAIWGVVVARRRKVPVYPLLAFFLLAVVVVLPTIGAVRYRSMAELSLVMLAAVAFDEAWRRISARRTTVPRESVASSPEPAVPV